MTLPRIRAILIAAILGAAVLSVPSAAAADAGNFCGHGDTSHWHGLAFNAITYRSGRTFYSGSTLVHTHLYDNAYVGPGQGWNEDETNYCSLH